MCSFSNEPSDDKTEPVERKTDVINILRNPIFIPGNDIVRDQRVFNKFFVNKRNVVLGIREEAGETRKGAAVFLMALCRARINLFAYEGDLESAHTTLEDYDSWADVIAKAGGFSSGFDILEVPEAGIAEMRMVLNAISNLQAIQKRVGVGGEESNIVRLEENWAEKYGNEVQQGRIGARGRAAALNGTLEKTDFDKSPHAR